MTDVQAVRVGRYRELWQVKGLEFGQAPDGRRTAKSSRNAFKGSRTVHFRASQVECSRMLTSLDSTLVATSVAMDASDLEFSRFLYDDQPSGRCRVAKPKSQLDSALAGRSTARPAERSHMSQ